MYELMASPHFDWSEPPELRVWRKQAENGKENVKLESFGPKENVHVMMAALEENKVSSFLSCSRVSHYMPTGWYPITCLVKTLLTFICSDLGLVRCLFMETDQLPQPGTEITADEDSMYS